MKTRAFPNCCTADIVYDLGGTPLSGEYIEDRPEEEIKKYLEDKIRHVKGYKCIVIMTNSQQTIANRILRELKFKASSWMKKTTHPESKIRLWWKEPIDKKKVNND